ncbi:hypothetical protein ACUN7V_18590 [Quadrisphaera oryzae]|uniref:hypothetical protein n=1 Tax=Quadrisphaera TaxID=317661 RepID=UPI001645C4AD|nr:hypothetical protein [Quadrisphaera sp. RL12-1S]MBC3763962.1 hypothetical protein [Quadrisphaera sp. RL12-1S]
MIMDFPSVLGPRVRIFPGPSRWRPRAREVVAATGQDGGAAPCQGFEQLMIVTGECSGSP